ncbi:MAG: hypothetical protein LHV68_03200 [Elusimicrobia bacterium]|nr:hypothetical protein [Candidatus Liberimonas magnetica]
MYQIFIPTLFTIALGFYAMLVPKKNTYLHKIILVCATLNNFILGIYLFIKQPYYTSDFIRVDNLALLTLLAVGFFGFFISVYSLKYFSDDFNFKGYSIYTLFTIGAASAVGFVNNFILLVFFWGFLGLPLYLLISLSQEATAAAKKAFIFIGGSDALMIVGIAIIYFTRGTWTISGFPIPAAGFGFLAFIFLLVASLAKAGAVPVHTWVPDVSQKAFIPVTALLIATLDKLLGIYLLARIVNDVFINSPSVTSILLIVGASTIIIAVMMALVQHDFKKLLGYHAVSQVGYMVVGIGTGNPVGFIGGIFHMINHTLYKSTLFLSGGAVEKQTGTANLDELGGLSKLMPLTFLSALVASLSISGIPPFNGFVSKWLIYQGLITSFNNNHSLITILVLVTAMIGSALTLASFMKLIHATYLAAPKKPMDFIKEAHWAMLLPMVLFSGLCIIFGVFSYQIPLKLLIKGNFDTSIGIWQPTLATFMVISGLVLGFVLYFIFFKKYAVRFDDSFVGGETQRSDENPSGTEFYNTITNIKIFDMLYKGAEQKFFDIYDLSSRFIFFIGGIASKMHTGIIHTYLAWCLIGILFLFWILL